MAEYLADFNSLDGQQVQQLASHEINGRTLDHWRLMKDYAAAIVARLLLLV